MADFKILDGLKPDVLARRVRQMRDDLLKYDEHLERRRLEECFRQGCPGLDESEIRRRARRLVRDYQTRLWRIINEADARQHPDVRVNPRRWRRRPGNDDLGKIAAVLLASAGDPAIVDFQQGMIPLYFAAYTSASGRPAGVDNAGAAVIAARRMCSRDRIRFRLGNDWIEAEPFELTDEEWWAAFEQFYREADGAELHDGEHTFSTKDSVENDGSTRPFEPVDPESERTDALERAILRDELAAALDTLKPRERIAIMLDSGGASGNEIAAALGTTPGAAWQTLSRAKKRAQEAYRAATEKKQK